MGGKKSTPSGIAQIENLYFEQGQAVAEERLVQLLGPHESAGPCHVSDWGQPSLRTDVNDKDGILYKSYNPPATWNAPYSVQLVTFENKEKADYMFHSGEELLVPMSGRITYHFYWSPGRKKPERVTMREAAAPGTLLRINPQIPHHTWAITPKATGWMIFRYATDSPAALVVDENSPARV